jgi:chromate reductase
MKLVFISGSAQESSLNERFLLNVWRKIKESSDYDLELLSLRTLNLPLFIGYESSKDKRVDRLRAIISEADGYVIACPEYHHALPAILKNMFEHLQGSEMNNKPVLLFGATTGQFGTVRSQHSFYGTLRAFQAWLVPLEVFISRADTVINHKDEITEPSVEKRLDQAIDLFVKAVKLLSQLR